MSAEAAPPFPSRAERKACWNARDSYYACLDLKGVAEPGTETGGACDAQLKEYAGSCARSWVCPALCPDVTFTIGSSLSTGQRDQAD